MNSDVALTPSLLASVEIRNRSVVVIDVLRASTTITTALFHGAESVTPFASAEEVFKRAEQEEQNKVLLCGERGGIRVQGFDLGNSPYEYDEKTVRDKNLLFTSTNGAQILTSVQEAAEIFVAGFVNMAAVVKRLLDKNRDCVLACAGREENFSIEDTVCAGMIIQGLLEEENKNRIVLGDEAHAALVLYRHHAENLGSMIRGSAHGQYLASIGMDRDLELCATVDLYNSVPFLSDGKLVVEPDNGQTQ